MIAQPATFAGDARLVPAVKDGKPHGFKIYAIKPESTVAKLGIRNGDTVLAIAGQPLNSVDDAIAVLSTLHDLKVGQTVTVSIERSTVPTPMVYTIR